VTEITVDGSASKDPDKKGVFKQWHWSGSAGVIFASPDSVTSKVTVSKDGTYDISLYVQDKAGNKSPVVTKQLIVNPEPVKNKPINFGIKVVGLQTAD